MKLIIVLLFIIVILSVYCNDSMNWQLQSNNDDNKGIKFKFVHVGKVCKLDKKTNYSLEHGDLNLHGSKIM